MSKKFQLIMAKCDEVFPELAYHPEKGRVRMCVSSLFNNINEIETKVLDNSESEIIVHDDVFGDFNIKRNEGSNVITYKDVIDQLLKQGFSRSEYDHKFLETIRFREIDKLTGLKVYSMWFGS
jgi:aspartyl/asparaginyl-tRNA synthetase